MRVLFENCYVQHIHDVLGELSIVVRQISLFEGLGTDKRYHNGSEEGVILVSTPGLSVSGRILN